MTTGDLAPDTAHFQVAFSFAGEERERVLEIAEVLAQRLGRDAIFYDEWHQEYISGPDGDQRLAEIYASKADLVVVCVSQAYADKMWPRLEQRPIRERVARAPLTVLPLRVGEGLVPGFTYATDIVPDVRDKPASDAAALIESRLKRLGVAGSLAGAVPPQPTPQRTGELAYLAAFVQNPQFRDRTERYVALAGVQRTAPTLARALSVPMSLKAFRPAGSEPDAATEMPVARTYDDALDAYRDVAQRGKARRLAVLGEPGAGKSFSLERIALEYAQAARDDPGAPIPILLALGLWTDPQQSLTAFIDQSLTAFLQEQVQTGTPNPPAISFDALRQERRVVLLLDGLNEIPPGQRKIKAQAIATLSDDARLVSVLVSCREKDFTGDFALPFDTLTLQPLTPRHVRDCLRQMLALYYRDTPDLAPDAAADAFFWRLAGDPELAGVWQKWASAGADFDLFWTAEDLEKDLSPTVYAAIYATLTQDDYARWYTARTEPRSLLRLAANPFLLTAMVEMQVADQLPSNRAELFACFLGGLYDQERSARERRGDLGNIPERKTWESALASLAEAIQRRPDVSQGDGAQTSIAMTDCPSTLTPAIRDFSRDASVLQQVAGKVRFTHQLLQEYLASKVLLEASTAPDPANPFWPPARWWQRTGWEVVAEIAWESLSQDHPAQIRLIRWLASANPEVAAEVLRRFGNPTMPVELLAELSAHWLPRLTDPALEPAPAARAAIGRALGELGLDTRPGIGLTPDGLPDIAWISIPSLPFLYQGKPHAALPEFRMSRYPITYAQYDAFVRSPEYLDDRWWWLKDGPPPASPARTQPRDRPPAQWTEPNSPRDTVDWWDALAFCSWLSHRLGYQVTLPTEQQWERAACGTQGAEYPWGAGYRPGYANLNETVGGNGAEALGRTTTPGMYPQGTSAEGVDDLAGNLWEWCLNDAYNPERFDLDFNTTRVIRGGCWQLDASRARGRWRFPRGPMYRLNTIGFRIVCNTAMDGPA